jgi:diguanylate cyclase
VAEPADSQETEDDVLQASDIDVDLLNNIGNKTMFCQSVHRRIAEFKRGGARFSTLLLCVDNSQELVRSNGEPTWKLVMGVVAQAIRGRLREMDLMARYNEGTFGMILPDASLRNAICVGERLRKTVDNTTIQLDGKMLRFTVSVGAVEVEESDEMATLVERARTQLDKAQNLGGNRTGYATTGLVAS